VNDGGGIYITSNGNSHITVAMAVTGCSLFGNTATVGDGGAIFNGQGALTVSNTTFGKDNSGNLVPNTADDIFGPYVDEGGNWFFH
jgi:hypothetical protein